jgi:hypothetical protein
MPLALSGTVSWLTRVPGNGMKNSPMSDERRWAALVLSASAPANSLRSSRPSSTLVSFGGWAPSGGIFVKSAWPYDNWVASDTFQPAGTT